MLRSFSKALEQVPISPSNPGESILRIQAVSAGEAPILERAFNDPVDIKAVVDAAAEFHNEDCAYSFETWWGVWVHDKEWVLRPSRLTLFCFGPRYIDSPRGDDEVHAEHIRVDFGVDTWFLPQSELPNPTWYARSNLKGLLKFVHSLDDALPLERRALWTESGGNFAQRLQEAAADIG